MRQFVGLVAMIVIGQPFARADGPTPLFDGCYWTYPKLCAAWRQRRCWCCDDYLQKTLPCVPTNPLGCSDDYCRKSLPCVPPNPKGCVDDYCRKKCPILLGNLCEPWYLCGPPDVPGPCQPCTSKR